MRRVVGRAFQYHVLPPAALGSGAEKVLDKASAVVHQLRLECSSDKMLFRLLENSLVSCTTDMGAELHLSDVRARDKNSFVGEGLRLELELRISWGWGFWRRREQQ